MENDSNTASPIEQTEKMANSPRDSVWSEFLKMLLDYGLKALIAGASVYVGNFWIQNYFAFSKSRAQLYDKLGPEVSGIIVKAYDRTIECNELHYKIKRNLLPKRAINLKSMEVKKEFKNLADAFIISYASDVEYYFGNDAKKSTNDFIDRLDVFYKVCLSGKMKPDDVISWRDQALYPIRDKLYTLSVFGFNLSPIDRG